MGFKFFLKKIQDFKMILIAGSIYFVVNWQNPGVRGSLFSVLKGISSGKV